MTMNLKITFLGLKLDNPLILASGILGTTGASLAAVARAGAGAVTTKTIFLNPRKGHQNPTVLHLGGGNCLNAVGLPAGGIETGLEEIVSFRKLSKTSLIASIGAETLADWPRVTRIVSEQGQPDALEVDISCPNVEKSLAGVAFDPQKTAKVIRAVRRVTQLPLIAKLSPNAPNIIEVARAAEAAGCDALNCGNSVGPGMVIDLEARSPVLANKVGGLSGPLIRPIAVRCVYQVSQAVKIPVIGTGGVATGRDALEMILAGASVVGIGSAVAHRGPTVFAKVAAEMEAWLTKEKVKNWREIRGQAH
jgi:dihydroorotate dehydrogenase (NAD+) catalytic subunit